MSMLHHHVGHVFNVQPLITHTGYRLLITCTIKSRQDLLGYDKPARAAIHALMFDYIIPCMAPFLKILPNRN